MASASFENDVITILHDINSKLGGGSSTTPNPNGNSNTPSPSNGGSTGNGQKSKYEKEKEQRKIANIINTATGMATAAIKTYTDYQLTELRKSLINYTATIQSATSDLETSSKIAANNIKLAGKAITSSMQSTFNILTGGIKESAFSTFDSITTTAIESVSTQLDNDLLLFKNTNQKYLIEKQKELDLYKENTKQLQSFIDGGSTMVSGITSMATSNPIIGAAVNSVIDLTKSIFNAYRSIQEAESDAEIQRRKTTIEYNEKLIDSINKLGESVLNQAQEIAKTVVNAAKESYNFNEKLDENASKIAIELGKSQKGNTVSKMINTLRNQMLTDGVYMNISSEDIAKLQQRYTENSGFAVELSSNDIYKHNVMSQLWDENTVGQISSAMQLYNHSVSDSSEMMFEMYQLARKNGLSQAKFSKELAKNLKLAEKHQFKGGVKGLMEMTVWAQKVRFNMDNFGAVLDKMKDGGIEGAIENSAQLQVLGGNFAMGADPLAMLWESYNSPQDYAKRLKGMVRGMGSFNNKTGEVDFNAGEQMMLASMAKATGQSVEDLMNIQRQEIKSKKIDSLLTKRYSDAQKNLIYSKALKNENGIWEVNGKDINSLTDGDFAELESTEKGILNYVKEIAGLMPQKNKEEGAKQKSNADVASETYDTYINSSDKIIKDDLTFYRDNLKIVTEELKKGYQSIVDTNKISLDRFVKISGLVDDALEVTMAATKGQVFLDEKITELGGDIKSLKKQIDNNGVLTIEAIKKAFDEIAKNHDMDTRSAEEITIEVEKIPEAIENWKKEIESDMFGRNLVEARTDLAEMLSKYMENGIVDYDKLSKSQDWKNFAEKDTHDDELLNNLRKFAGVDKASDVGASILKQIVNLIDSDAENRASKIGNISNNGIDDLTNQGIAAVQDGKDFIASNSNKPMLTAASSVTPIQDGSVQLAKSDPKDSAIFAKSGGPFDTLFNGIFAKINEISDVLPKSMEYLMPIDVKKLLNESLGNSKYTTNNPNIQINPIKIELNGKLELTSSNGQSVDIINMLRTDQSLMRNLCQMISENINENIYGGRSTFNAGAYTPRFNKL